MRIGPPPAPPSPSFWSAQLTQTLVQVASNRSSTSDRPIEPISAVARQMTLPRVEPRILDIRV